MGDPSSILINPIIFPFFFSSPFSFKSRRLWVQSTTSTSFFLIYLLIFSPIQEVVGSIPTLPIYILLYFSPNSLIHSRGCGFNPLTTSTFPCIFFTKFLWNFHLVRSWVKSPITSHLKKKLNEAHFLKSWPRLQFSASWKFSFFLSIFVLIFCWFFVAFM